MFTGFEIEMLLIGTAFVTVLRIEEFVTRLVKARAK